MSVKIDVFDLSYWFYLRTAMLSVILSPNHSIVNTSKTNILGCHTG